MESIRSKTFTIDDVAFMFTENRKRTNYDSKFKLMYYSPDLACWVTLCYPDNYTKAKEYAKDFVKYL